MARVGLLEDNPRIAKLCATMLKFAGHSVTVYLHPRECLNALLSLPVNPGEKAQVPHMGTLSALPIEVLILDLQLPEISGIEVLQYLQSIPSTRSLPLIFCTASNPSDVTGALHIAPHASVLEKPFKLEALTSAVDTALKLQNI